MGRRGALGDEAIHRIGLVGVAERHAADDDLLVRDAEHLADDRVEVGEGDEESLMPPAPHASQRAGRRQLPGAYEPLINSVSRERTDSSSRV